MTTKKDEGNTIADDEKLDYSAYHLVGEQMFTQHNFWTVDKNNATDCKTKSSVSESFLTVAGSLWFVFCLFLHLIDSLNRICICCD